MENESRKKRKEYSAEFKAEAVRLVKSGERSQAEVAKNLGLGSSTISKWCKELESKDESDNAAKVRRLEAEVKRLRLEQDILKKAATYFAKNLT